MFTVSELEVMREDCPTELDALLKSLGLNDALPAEGNGDNFSGYQALDDKLSREMCRRLKADTVMEGCFSLLRMANISFGYNETLRELIAKIIENKDAVRKAATSSQQ